MEIAIYFEGGGDSAESKAILRQGMSGFLKPLVDQARQRRSRWRVVSCGGRNDAFNDFMNATQVDPHVFNVLLVDSEDAVVVSSPRTHLQTRDHWNLNAVTDEHIHLMVQCMETWLVSDPEALAEYYKQHFNPNPLPQRPNLEQELKPSLYAALDAATRHTQKGAYGKISHGSDLLKRISADKVKARCPHCQLLFNTVAAKIQE